MTVSQLPIREPTFFILAALQEQPLHGYAVMTKAEELSQGRVKLSTGTLYAALDRLAGEDLVRVVDERVVNGRARRYYTLTATGREVLVAEANRMAEAASVVTGPRTAQPRTAQPRTAQPRTAQPRTARRRSAGPGAVPA
jgi:PadR family transcriptional regulator, regulatory protein PadR